MARHSATHRRPPGPARRPTPHSWKAAVATPDAASNRSPACDATGGWITSSPAVGADGTVYVGSWNNNLYALNPDGSTKWSYPTGGSVESSPAIAADGTVYVGSNDGKLYALKPDGA
ncbi:MAG: PQQ-like beta-propeller repeat protein, partial [Brevundimonas diminuta]|nr:PQQ-like beta-propeller repeat protein [Brevundimonas diminuta]